MKLAHKPTYRFADIEIDVTRGCLRRDGQEHHLRQQTFLVLLYLLAQRQRLVTKDELIEQIWNGTAVTDNALVQCIADIRKTLHDDPRNPRLIKTIPKVGYRFIGEVEECFPGNATVIEIEEVTSTEVEYKEEIIDPLAREVSAIPVLTAPLARPWFKRPLILTALLAILFTATVLVYSAQHAPYPGQPLKNISLPHVAGKKALVVSYFDNQSATAELEWLRAGLADMFIASLSRSQNLTLLSRQHLQVILARRGHRSGESVPLEAAIDIATKVNAEVVVLGSFARLGEKIRVDVQLHDTSTGQLLTAHGFIADKPEQLGAQIDQLGLKLVESLLRKD